MMSKCIFVPESCILYFIYFLYFFHSKLFYFPFPFKEISNTKTVNIMSAPKKNTLMAISDGLGPSIFCRKMEKARLMMEEMDRKVVYFPPESAILILM